MEELQQTLKCRAQAAMNLLHEGICRTEQKLQQCLHVLADVQEDVRKHQEAQAHAIQDDYNKKLQQLTESFEQQVLILQQQTQAQLADLQDAAADALQQAAQALLQQLQLEQPPELLEQAAQLSAGPSQGSEICAEVSLACLAMHKQVLQDLQQAKQGQLKPVLLSELLVPRSHDNHTADADAGVEQPGADLQAELQGHSCDGSVAAASVGRSPSDCSALHSPGRCMSAAAEDTSSVRHVLEDQTAQLRAAYHFEHEYDAKSGRWDSRDAACDTQWAHLQDQVELKPASTDRQQGPDATRGWPAGQSSLQEHQRHQPQQEQQQQQQRHQQPSLALSFQPQQLAFARSPSGSSGTASPLYRQDDATGPHSKQLPYVAATHVNHRRCGSADVPINWEGAQHHAATPQPEATGSAGSSLPSNIQRLFSGPGRTTSSNSIMAHRHSLRPGVSDWADRSRLTESEQQQPACKDMFCTPCATPQLIRPGQEQPAPPAAYTPSNRQLKALSSLPARLPPASGTSSSAKPMLRRCVSNADADARGDADPAGHTAALLRSTTSTRRQLESSWRQGLAKAAGKASATPASLAELRAVGALDARLKGVSSRRSSLAMGSMGSGSESDDFPQRQLQPRSSASSARHSQPKAWLHLAREQMLQPDHTQGHSTVACPPQRTHTLKAVAVEPWSGSGGWPGRKAGALSRNSSKSGRPVASSALELLD